MQNKSNETIAGLRFQKYGTGEVHVHDDTKKVKFISSVKNFKLDMKNALKQLNKDDGAVILGGTSKERLILIREGKSLTATVVPDQDITSELNSFVSTL